MSIKSPSQKIQAGKYDVPIILVVEDEVDNLLYIAHSLVFLKYSFIVATTGREALDLASKYKIDLLLLDLVLPDISGFELISLLKNNESTQNIPIIAISALVREKEQKIAMKSGCNKYLNKPYLIDELAQAIRNYLPQALLKNY